jgi:diaminopimelate epimerase
MSINKEIINFEAIKFISMNGAGNKILIHDSRNQNIEIDEKLIIFLSNNDRLIEFDQFVGLIVQQMQNSFFGMLMVLRQKCVEMQLDV